MNTKDDILPVSFTSILPYYVSVTYISDEKLYNCTSVPRLYSYPSDNITSYAETKALSHEVPRSTTEQPALIFPSLCSALVSNFEPRSSPFFASGCPFFCLLLYTSRSFFPRSFFRQHAKWVLFFRTFRSSFQFECFLSVFFWPA